MENKKSPRADLQTKQPLFLQLGLVLALSTALFAFELRTFVNPPLMPFGGKGSTTLTENILNTTREQPRPPEKVTIPVSILIIVPDDDDIIIDDGPIWGPDWATLPDWKPAMPAPEPEDTSSIEYIVPFPDVFAQFKGGESALYAWLAANGSYPQEEKIMGVQGTVYVQFVVERDGSIGEAHIARGIPGGRGLEEVALGMVKKMPNWNPAKQRNRPVRSWYVLPVNFEIR